jgi:hypothetical protein
MSEKETIKIDYENYKNVRELLKSKDKDSVALGFMILENANFSKSLPFILMMLRDIYETSFVKETFVRDQLTIHAPKLMENLFEYFKSTNIDSVTKISYNFINSVVLSRNSKEELEFFYNVMGEKFASILKAYGFNYMDQFEIKIIPKTNG